VPGTGTDAVFAGTTDRGVFRSGNDGDLWTAADAGLTDLQVLCLATDPTGTYLFAGTKTGLFRSSNNGEAWTKLSTGLPDVVAVTALGTSSAYMVRAQVWPNSTAQRISDTVGL
jgi:hypothetical protein